MQKITDDFVSGKLDKLPGDYPGLPYLAHVRRCGSCKGKLEQFSKEKAVSMLEQMADERGLSMAELAEKIGAEIEADPEILQKLLRKQ